MRTARRPTTTAMAGRAADHPHVHHHPPPPCQLCGGVGPVSRSGLAQRLAAPGGHRHAALSGSWHHSRWGGSTTAGLANCYRSVRHAWVGRGAPGCRQESGQGWNRAGADRAGRVVVGGRVRRGAPLPVVPHQAAAVRARAFRWACELGGSREAQLGESGKQAGGCRRLRRRWPPEPVARRSRGPAGSATTTRGGPVDTTAEGGVRPASSGAAPGRVRHASCRVDTPPACGKRRQLAPAATLARPGEGAEQDMRLLSRCAIAERLRAPGEGLWRRRALTATVA